LGVVGDLSIIAGMSFTRFGMNKTARPKKHLKKYVFTFPNGELFRFELNAFEPCLMR